MPTLAYNRTNSVVANKPAIILIIRHNIFNLCDTEVVICIILVPLKRADGRITTQHITNVEYDKNSGFQQIFLVLSLLD
jgi:hypothetical protein